MRVLMVQAARDSANEYKVHRLLGQHAQDSGLTLSWLCQDSPLARRENRELGAAAEERVRYVDFGRDMHSEPLPSRAGRALAMGRALPRALASTLALARAVRPDVIYCSQQSYDVTIGRVLSRLLRKPLFVHLHYNVGPFLGRLTLARILRADTVVCVSSFIREQALAAGVAAERAFVVHNAANLSAFDVPRSRQALLAAFALPESARVVIAAGRLDPGKGHLALLEAFASARQSVPDARLVVCGATTTRDDYAARIAARAEQLGLAQHVIFAGSRSDLPALFAGADVLCLPTELEPFGLVFLEAMAAGLAVVAYRSGGVPEIVEHERTGLLAKPGDVPGLATHLSRLLQDRVLGERLGSAGKLRAATAFAPGRIARAWAELLLSRAASS